MKLHPVFRQSAFALVFLGATPLLNDAEGAQGFSGTFDITHIGHHYCGPEVSGHVDILAGDNLSRIPAGQIRRHCVNSDNWPAIMIEEKDSYLFVYPEINERGRSHPPAEGEVFPRRRIERALKEIYNSLDKLEYGETFERTLDPYSLDRPPAQLRRID